MSQLQEITNFKALEVGHPYMIKYVMTFDTIKYKGIFTNIEQCDYAKCYIFNIYDAKYSWKGKDEGRYFELRIMDYCVIAIYKLPSFEIGRDRLLKQLLPKIANKELTLYVKEFLY
jgi:hypothetical protein